MTEGVSQRQFSGTLRHGGYDLFLGHPVPQTILVVPVIGRELVEQSNLLLHRCSPWS